MAELSGKTAIVTGGGRGLGRAFAQELLEAGANVTVASRTQADLDAVAAQAEGMAGRALACAMDVTDEDSVQAMVDRTLAEFGRIDILVSNSGVIETIPLVDQTTAGWDRVIDTNLRGTFLVTRAVGRHLVPQRSGKVITVASHFGLFGVANHAAYSASKAAIIAFTRAMAIEWARYNIQVNAIAPGYFATDLNAELRADEELTAKVTRGIPLRRMGTPGELGPWVRLLAGPASDFMTGEVIVVDGGQSVK